MSPSKVPDRTQFSRRTDRLKHSDTVCCYPHKGLVCTLSLLIFKLDLPSYFIHICLWRFISFDLCLNPACVHALTSQSVILKVSGHRSELLFLTHYIPSVNELLMSVNRYCSKNISFLLNKKAHIHIERNVLMTVGKNLKTGNVFLLLSGLSDI